VFVTGTFLRDCLLCGGLSWAVMVWGCEVLAYARTAASADVVSSLEASFLHLPPLCFGFAGENLPLRACDVVAFAVVSFLRRRFQLRFAAPLLLPGPGRASGGFRWGVLFLCFFFSLLELFSC
jgi:hypothetical protein